MDTSASFSMIQDHPHYLFVQVTVPLMDVALECLVSSSGRHHQKYVLLAPQPYRATSRCPLPPSYCLSPIYSAFVLLPFVFSYPSSFPFFVFSPFYMLILFHFRSTRSSLPHLVPRVCPLPHLAPNSLFFTHPPILPIYLLSCPLSLTLPSNFFQSCSDSGVGGEEGRKGEREGKGGEKARRRQKVCWVASPEVQVLYSATQVQK